MKKILLVATTLVLIFALTSWATETRVMTMGNANNIVKDEANIWLYPSTITMYPDLALGEFGWSYYAYPEYSEWDFQSLGFHYAMGEGGTVVGLYLSKMPWMSMCGLCPGISFNPDPYTFSCMDPDNPQWPNGVDHRISAFFGTPIGDHQFGAALSYWGDSYSVDGDTANETSMSNMIIDFTAGMTIFDNTDLALNFGFQTWTNEDDQGETVNEPNGNMKIALAGRHWMDFGNDYVGIPHAAFGYCTNGEKVPDSYEDKYNTIMFDLGWGMNLNPAERILAVGDLGFTYISEKNTYTPDVGNEMEMTHSDFVLPYFRLGLEGHVTDWWDVRVGAVKKWHMISHARDEDVSDKYGQAETNTYLGTGIYLGNLTLDLQIHEDFMRQGPNFVSGYDDDLVTRLSLKYNFGD